MISHRSDGNNSLNATPERPLHEEQEGGSVTAEDSIDLKLARNHTFKKRFDSVS